MICYRPPDIPQAIFKCNFMMKRVRGNKMRNLYQLFFKKLDNFASAKVTYPDANEKPLLRLCSAELAGATETSVLDG